MTFTNETLDFTTTKDYFLIGGKSLQYWLDDAIGSYHETDPFFSSWIGSPDITFSNQIVRFQNGTSSIYIEGHTLAWWLEQAVLPTQTDLNTFKISTNGKIDVLTENLHNLSTRYDASVREIERLGGDLNAFNSTIDEMNRDVAGFRADLLFFKMTLRDFQIYVTNNFERLNDADIALGARIDNTNAELEEFETETTNTIARLEAKDAENTDNIESLSNRVVTVEEDLEYVSNKVNNVKTDLNTTSNLLDVAISAKLDATNGIATGSIKVQPDTNDPSWVFGLGKVEVTHDAIKFLTPGPEPITEYKQDKIVLGDETYEFNDSTNGVARLKDVDSATNKLYQTMTNEFVKMEDLQAGITFDNMEATNLTVNGERVAVKSDVSSATNSLYSTITNEFVRMADLQEGIQFNTMEVTNLTVNGKQVSLEGHTHNLWEIPGAEAAATNATKKIEAASSIPEIKDAMIEFLSAFKRGS